jgi:hypothetical protein
LIVDEIINVLQINYPIEKLRMSALMEVMDGMDEKS